MQLEVIGDTLCALVTAAVLASTGHRVLLKLPKDRIKKALKLQQETYIEPGLQQLLKANEERINYLAIDDCIARDSVAIFIAIKPQQISIVKKLVKELHKLNRPLLIINQTTFPIGTSEKIARLLPQHQVVYMPDVIQEGAAIQSFTHPNCFILGQSNNEGVDLIKEIFRSFIRMKDSFLLMPLRDAEFTKLAISGMLATRVTFMNDLAGVAESIGVDIKNIRQGIGSDSRIGSSYLYAGCGFGGLSFSRDVNSLLEALSQSSNKSHFFEQILKINESQKELLFRKLWQYYQADISGKTIAIWGAAFKTNTNKIDNAPVLRIIDALLAQDVIVKVHDPQALVNLKHYYADEPKIIYCSQQYEAVKDADALMLVTEWENYWNPDFTLLKQTMHTPLILDGRNIYNPEYVKQQGFDYIGIGRK